MKKVSAESASDLSESTDAYSARTKLLAIICGVAVVLSLLVTLFGGGKTNFEDAATLGAQTTSVFAKAGKHLIHCIDSRDAADCIEGARVRSAEKSVLWLGNSQVHAVNQWRQGETNATPLLFESLGRRGLDVVAFSQPNANLQEHYVLFEYLRRRLPLRALILPVVFDDLREEGLRTEVATLARDEPTALNLSVTETGRRLVAIARTTAQEQETAGIAHTMQERVEWALNGWLESHSPLWGARPTIRGEIFVGLYRLRNTLFGVKATSKRKMIPGQYRSNWTALEATLAEARRSGIGVVLYVAPLRDDAVIPYDANEYSRFKADLKKLAEQYGAVYSNLEALVPAKLWGAKDSTSLSEEAELDFMHFQAGGHKLLAAKLEHLVLDVLAIRENRR